MSEFHARTTDPDTSHAAAELRDALAEKRIDRIVAVLERAPGGLTSNQIGDLLGERTATVSPYLRPLARAGRVHVAPEKRGRRLVWLPGRDPAGYVEPDRGTGYAAPIRELTDATRPVVEALAVFERGLTSLELAELMGLPLHYIAARMRPLERGGHIEEHGRRDGRIVWRIAR